MDFRRQKQPLFLTMTIGLVCQKICLRCVISERTLQDVSHEKL